MLWAAFTIALTLGSCVGFILLLVANHWQRSIANSGGRCHPPTVYKFFLVPLGYVADEMLSRAVRFDLLKIAQTASAVLGATLLILLAWMGYWFHWPGVGHGGGRDSERGGELASFAREKCFTGA